MARNITVSNIFGDFANGQELLEHFTKIWGEDGFFHAWRVYMESLDILKNFRLGTFPEVEEFCHSLFIALEGLPF